MAEKPIQAIIWAIDPFESETKPDRAVLRQLNHWAEDAGIPIQPVHVLGLSSGYEEMDETQITDQRPVPSAEKVSRSYLRSLEVGSTLPPKVVLAPASSRKNEIKKLLALGDLHDSPMIVVSSHGRKGWDRLALGSFSETLLQESKRPVLFLTHAQAESRGRIRKILFPTDLSERSRAAFQTFLPQAKLLRAEIVLFHAVAIPVSAIAPGGFYGTVESEVPDDYFKILNHWAETQGAEWLQDAVGFGVPAKLVVKDEGLSNQIGRSILRAARAEDVQLIAMASLSGPLSSFVVGSVAREVFRAREFPVWVCGPKAIDEIMKRTQKRNYPAETHAG